MSNIQEVFDRVQKNKKELQNLKSAYRDALAGHGGYQKTMEQLRAYKMNKKKTEDQVKEEMGKDYQRIEELQFDIKSDQELLSDLSLNSLVKGESIEVTDDAEQKYEPVFIVRFQRRHR